MRVNLPESYSPEDVSLVMRAEEFATNAHAGQKRKSGEPYIIHPLAVAQTVADWGFDAQTLAAALLHDTVEDTAVTVQGLAKEFGPKVAELVDGVTKLGQVDFNSEGTNRSHENLRKLLVAMSRDLRVIIIKLADRKHNLATLKYLNEEDRVRIAKESLAIFAPLADRLGMGRLKAEIEDAAFKYSEPERYAELSRELSAYTKKANRYIAKLREFITSKLAASGVATVSVEGRPKHLYSVYKKLTKTGKSIDKVYDLLAVRVIVPKESDCYQALGILHQYFKPLIYRIKDYISVPKPNGYRSLHTTVFALEGRITEIQIRTPQMHEEAEMGLAAHFFYDQQKLDKKQPQGVPKNLQWVGQLAKFEGEMKADFVDMVSHDLFVDRIFIFTPKGDLFDLPEGSTPLDFAFAVHTDIGLHAMGALVNGKMQALGSHLENRDVVQIITRRSAKPTLDWLNHVKSSMARSRIKSWLRSQGIEPANHK